MVELGRKGVRNTGWREAPARAESLPGERSGSKMGDRTGWVGAGGPRRSSIHADVMHRTRGPLLSPTAPRLLCAGGLLFSRARGFELCTLQWRERTPPPTPLQSTATSVASISGEQFVTFSVPPISTCTFRGFGFRNFGVRRATLSLLRVGKCVV